MPPLPRSQNRTVLFDEPCARWSVSDLRDVAERAGFQVIPAREVALVTRPDQVASVLEQGATWLRVDPSELVIEEASLLDADELTAAREALLADEIFGDDRWPEAYQAGGHGIEEEEIVRTGVQFGWAIEQVARIAREDSIGDAAFEIQFPNRSRLLTAWEHTFIGLELKRRDVKHFALALSWPGRWEPAIDLDPDEDAVALLEQAVAEHARLAARQGPWSLSFPHAEGKQAALPALSQPGIERLHLHLSSVSWCEALRVFAREEPAVLRSLLPAAQDRFVFDKPLEELQTTEEAVRVLPEVEDGELERVFIDDPRGRQLLHVTGRSLLNDPALRGVIDSALNRHAALHAALVRERAEEFFAPWLGGARISSSTP